MLLKRRVTGAANIFLCITGYSKSSRGARYVDVITVTDIMKAKWVIYYSVPEMLTCVSTITHSMLRTFLRF